ncbi:MULTISPECIES: glycine--tRNA ligase subunit beta [Pseudomonas]|jgi:glycyl-tRNA synthetase beta chain|uniref:Glycine--tRNA ligase beta subunit n=2 Tax=Pseudomonas putida TaxID=303 RepID=SYGB_PSEPW|nr:MULTISPECIES: glycine--tRNA ligase subunit beta [Pseudomonas]B1J425.1 RecName: Full=Glycine--tRNA ligase beta subunit; AltName: Full=Glycyl-tRNA synthetase beta subunit; Short=GlyRS [Pseudomonas putida W619]QPN45522.1 glycine--tRNA ligase subunit beta [Priestia aryabhattai]KAF1305970.1 glycine--tRNA ligase subunit beta [Pseudomonas sp. SG-MS2]MBM7398548.1 glycyl-tRNA synthetase beta chain [Pseudomonas sp. M5]MDH1573108.1 glycine--tRNA ligase subunit beta [Pseudomonas sp. GD03746]QQE84185.1
MSAQDFLVELGTEELPPKALATLGDAFLAGIEKGLQAAGLNYTGKQVYAAPRRLAVLIRQLDVQQPDRSINIDGPPLQAAFKDGEPTQAALGFAKKCGVELSEIDQSGAKLRFSQHIPGKATASLLPTIVEDSLNDLPIPKRMRWAASREEFVRPTQWLVMLLGDQVVDCTILSQQAGRESRGHRFHHPQNVVITTPANYVEDLRKAYVLADFAERRELIAKRTTELAMQQEGTAIVPPALLDEVTALVEWPVPLVCSFEERFLEVPQEALITTMQDNQKYFCLLDSEGKLLPRFITVANVESRDPKQIVSGNEKVVRPRLTDAEFFFKQDKKQPLETFNERLKNVVFQAQLGTVYDKAERVSRLAAYIAPLIGGDAQRAGRAGLLSKCDLATEMVGEFPEMQGVAGYYYALNDGEPQDVALALNEQYMPRGAGAELPQTLTGAAVAIADKLDTLVGIFGIGMLPTGSKDPYALRRAALGVLRILIEKQLDLDLTPAVEFAVKQFGAKVKAAGLAEQVLEFIFDRLRARYEDEGIDVATYLSVRALKPGSALDFDQRVQAVQAFRKLPEAEALAAVNKRVSNLLSKAEGAIAEQVEPKYFDNANEFSLYSAIQQADQAVQPMAAARQYSESLARLAALRDPVDAFFEAVMVNAEDAKVRANRYALLSRLRGLFLGVADISLLG